MRRILKLFRLPFNDVGLLAESVIALAFVRLGLSLLRFQTLRRWLARVSATGRQEAPPERRLIRKVVWSVNVVSAYLPFFRNCLNRALAAQMLLGRRGQLVNLRIGVKRDPEGEFKAHAWIESEDRVVLGAVDDLWQMTPLPPLNLRDVHS
jgi:hypothetical protein